ncbi:MAG TPA: DUF3015 family protein [Nitrospirota bacterium]|nr:DUF3015 family protein [Nitrospirota bacterium]
MKKLFAVAVLSIMVVFVVSSAFAASATGTARSNVGCGLGTMLFQNNADQSSLLQAFQATTNGTVGSQTFGVTSGTSECKQPTKFVSNERLNEFVVANMDNLAKDIARGNGETLEAFADLMQVPAEQRPEFYQKLQVSFAKIFTSESVVLANVVDNVADVSSTK